MSGTKHLQALTQRTLFKICQDQGWDPMFLFENDEPVKSIVDAFDQELECCWAAGRYKLCRKLISRLPRSSKSLLRQQLKRFNPDQKIWQLKSEFVVVGLNLWQRVRCSPHALVQRRANKLLVLQAIQRSNRRSRADYEQAVIAAWCADPDCVEFFDLLRKIVSFQRRRQLSKQDLIIDFEQECVDHLINQKIWERLSSV